MDMNSIAVKLDQRRGDWPKIAKAAGVSYSWLTKFGQGKIPNPGIITLQKLESALEAPGAAPPPVSIPPDIEE